MDLNVAMVNACEVAVVSVDYRLAVNTPVEGILEDCLATARWLLGDCEEFAGLPVIVVGESAGGHLSNSVSRPAVRTLGVPVKS